MILTQFQTPILTLRSDNGREYMSSILQKYFQDHGIHHQTSCVDTPQQNGTSERKNRHLLAVTRALLFTTHVPQHYWGEALLTAAYLINRIPSRPLGFKTPVEILKTTYPNTHLLTDIPLRVFGCVAYVHNNQGTKLDPKAHKCLFLGYPSSQKGYKCYSPSLKRMFVTMDVTFLEDQKYYTESPIQGENSQEWEFLTYNINLNSHQPSLDLGTSETTSYAPETTCPEPETDSIMPETVEEETRAVETTETATGVDDTAHELPAGSNNAVPEMEINDSPSSRSLPRSRQGQESTEIPGSDDLRWPIALRKGVRQCTMHPISNYVTYDNLSTCMKSFVTRIEDEKIPSTFEEEVRDQRWKTAIEEELTALARNQTWGIMRLPQGKKSIGCKWVFTIKYNPDGTVLKFKARLVAKGYSQTPGIDYQETFAPVAKLNTIRILLSLAANLDWPLHQLDVKNAFLNGDLEDEVYMNIPEGLAEHGTPGVTCKLHKSLYGLKRSPRAWFQRFTRGKTLRLHTMSS